jgi:hypothetical protein
MQTIDMVKNGYNQALDFFQECENKLESYIPESWHPLAAKVARAIPETLFCLSIYTGTAKLAATAFWACKTTWVVYPFLDAALVKFQFDKDTIDAAMKETSSRLESCMQRLKPAIVVSAAVTAVFAAVLGAISLSPSLLMHATFFGIISHLAYNSMHAQNQVTALVPSQGTGSAAASAPPADFLQR